MADRERLTRNKQRASVRRDAAASQIEAIYNLGLDASTDSSSICKFLIAAKDLEEYWAKFTLENDTMLEAMIELGTDNEFSNNVELEVRRTVISAKSLAQQCRSGSVPASEVSQPEKPTIDQVSPEVEQVTNPTAQLGPLVSNLAPSGSNIRLPEIPLPTFDGRLQNWPDFRDRFVTLVDQKAHLNNIEKFYYLLGCLQAGPTDVVKGITVSDATYDLAWSALVNRYDKPRQLATTLVSEMLNADSHQQESPTALITFLGKFGENVALLRSLNIPDLGSFLLFSIAVRCLPSTSRRLFEQDNILDFPTVDSLLDFVKGRVEVLENAGTAMTPTVNKPQHKAQINRPKFGNNKIVAASTKPSCSSSVPPVALVSQRPTEPHKCEQCSSSHKLSACSKFKELSIDDRYALVSRHRLCMRCFANNHWANKCKTSCSLCHGRHHQLLHRDNTHAKVNPVQQPAVSLVSSQRSRSVLLGTASVNVRDLAGCLQPVRALIDPASQISIITSDFVKRLGLHRERWTVPVAGLAGQVVQSVDGRVQLSIQSVTDQSSLELPTCSLYTHVFSSHNLKLWKHTSI
ncbi:uncharacterized protein LOC126552594 [Aphis gossypii]|uniref:uncharacterized protein LOC126552594 n=1 Tax=Aphis gossypii TaxID=80765 RepID=UPI0021595543|nr:uncharacterized protein LOC126552594 [Aphis gossypii]